MAASILAALALGLSAALLPFPSYAEFDEEDPGAVERDPEYAKGKLAIQAIWLR